MRRAALAAAAVALCVSAAWAGGQQRQNPPRQAPRYSQPQARPQYRPQYRQAPQAQNRPQYRQQGPRGQYRQAPQGQYGQTPQNQYRPFPPAQGRLQGGAGQQPQTGYPATGVRPAYNGASGNAYANPGVAPQGHLEDWLNQHRNVAPQDQERMLRSDPSFKRLPSNDQQRLTQQLRQVDQMPEQQRQRRLARNEMLERLSPYERTSISRSGKQWAVMPQDRQAMMKRAFNDLRGVPPDQRQTVLNSAGYQGAFSPEERGILSDFLRVEPYEPRR